MCARLKRTHAVLRRFCACLSHSFLISRSYKWQCGADRFCLVLSLNSIISGSSLVALSSDASLSSSCPGLLGASLSEGCSSCGLSYIIRVSASEEVTWSLMEQSFLHAGRKSFMWRGIPSTETECWLLIYVTAPLPNCVMHLLYGFFTHTASPSMYGLEAVHCKAPTLHQYS